MAFLRYLFPEEDRLTKIVKRIGKIADQCGLEVYLVGGVIRDKFLGRPTKDIDIAVVGDAIEFAHKIAYSFRLKRVVEYREFGTASIPYRGINIEVATARSEVYRPDSRKPIVFESDLHGDLARRDFTINTLAMPLNEDRIFTLIDPFGGLRDLNSGLIRTPLDPVTTFSEDPLRILRAIRFATQLGFHIERSTFNAIREVKERLSIVSQERITEELKKIIMSPIKPSKGFILMLQAGLLPLVLPEVDALRGIDQRDGFHHKDVFYHTMQVLDNISKYTDKFELRFTALVHDIAKPVTKKFVEGKGWTFHGHNEVAAPIIRNICRRLRLPNKVMEYAVKLTRLHLRPISLAEEGVTDSAVRRLIVEAGEDLDDLITLCRADVTSKNPEKVAEYMGNFDRVVKRVNEVKEKDRLRSFQSPVRGDEIMQICNLQPGPAVGYIKKAIEEAILNGEIPNTYEAAKDFLLANKDRLLSEFQKSSSDKGQPKKPNSI